jgi:O-antigen/teichoic acid export membrane protein
MTAALAGRVALQAVMFFLVARTLGASEFGLFAAALAVVAVVMPFAAVGMGNVLVMRAAREPQLLSRYWSRSFVTLAFSAPALTLFVVIGGKALLPAVPLSVFLAICLAELLLVRVAEVSAQAFQATDLMAWMAAIVFGGVLARALAAVLMSLSMPSASASEWAVWYALAALVSALGSALAVRLRLQATFRPEPPSRADLREGMHFALALSANGVFTDADKALVARLDSFAAAGSYTLGYRVVSLSFTPVLALLHTTYASFFRTGAHGIRATRTYATELLPAAVAYSSVVGVALFFLAPLVPEVLGHDYEPAVETIRILAAMPLLQTFAYLAGDALVGAGHQALRSLLLWAGAAVGVVGALVLIPPFGATGAALATLIASVFLVAAFAIAITALSAREGGA